MRFTRPFRTSFGFPSVVVPMLVLALVAAPVVAAAFTPDSLLCLNGTCHTAQADQWKNSSPYTGGAYGELRGHNVTMPESLLNVEHNTAEILTSECMQCMSPFSARHLDRITPTTIDELATPIDQTGPWSLQPPYDTATLASDPLGFYFPGDHPTPTTVAAWEGISCRICHDTGHLTVDGLPRLRFFDAVTYRYQNVIDNTDLCTRCHQNGSDDGRSIPQESVHHGLQCTDCHMTAADGTVTHSLNAATQGQLLAETSCNRCHATPQPAGHPDVTQLTATSLIDPATYAADPLQLKKDPNQRHNIHFISCDACHPLSLAQDHYTVTSGKLLNLQGTRTDKRLPKAVDSGVVHLWVRLLGSTNRFTHVAASAPGQPGTAFLLRRRFTSDTEIYLTQSVSVLTFPGLGRGQTASVVVTP